MSLQSLAWSSLSKVENARIYVLFTSKSLLKDAKWLLLIWALSLYFYSYLFPNMFGRSKSNGRLIHVTLNMDTRVLMFVEAGSRRINIMSIYHNLSLMGVDSFISKTKRLPRHVGSLARLKRLGIFVKSIRFLSVKTEGNVYDVCLPSKSVYASLHGCFSAFFASLLKPTLGMLPLKCWSRSRNVLGSFLLPSKNDGAYFVCAELSGSNLKDRSGHAIFPIVEPWRPCSELGI